MIIIQYENYSFPVTKNINFRSDYVTDLDKVSGNESNWLKRNFFRFFSANALNTLAASLLSESEFTELKNFQNFFWQEY